MLSAAAATEYYSELRRVAAVSAARDRYALLRQIFRDVLDEAVLGLDPQPTAPYPQLLLLLRREALRRDTFTRLNAFRVRSQEARRSDEDELARAFPADAGSVVALVSELSGTPPSDAGLAALLHAAALAVPPSPTPALPPLSAAGRASQPYRRVVVDHWDDTHIYIYSARAREDEPHAVRYATENFYGDWSSLRAHLRPGSQLNLVRPRRDADGGLTADLFIYEPDFLLDISAIAACFETRSPLQHLLGRFAPPLKNNAYVLLGNFAGQLFDEAVHQADAEPPRPYADSSRDFFRQNALELATAAFPFDFHAAAAAQQTNLHQILRAARRATPPTLQPDGAILEPSFFCEMLGMQGRMDFLREDYTELVELKSGRRAFDRFHHEHHYVQVLLYRALLHYSYGLTNEEIHSYLLYSRYPADGLMLEGAAPKLLGDALRMRNALAAGEFSLASGGAEGILGSLNADALHCNPAHSAQFWAKYKRPAYQQILDTVQGASPLARAYFYRMLRFVAREQVLSRIGVPGREAGGFAALWASTFEEKQQGGSILAPLRLKIDATTADGGVEQVALVPDAGGVTLAASNFRDGDAVVLYRYAEDEAPDVRRGVVLRGSIAKLRADCLLLRLTAPQKNRHLFDEAGTYAVEHDSVDTSRPLYRGLFTLLEAEAGRRDLLLGQRAPQSDPGATLAGDYGAFNELVLGAKRARDYFLVVGPPGTGKTSFGMLNVLREALLTPRRTVLLTAFTNRAVDEICSKLVYSGIPFLRIGREVNCSRESQPHLLQSRAADCRNTREFRELLEQARVVAATTSTLCGNTHLFALKAFDLCIVDEASQILEPQILPLFTVKHRSNHAIGKFVLIGDHKQLPAVVQQSAEESLVAEPELRAIGLTDCRHSLFERLLPTAEAHGLVYRMTRQGRMHPGVAGFASEAFYGDTLQPVPLAHQRGKLDFPRAEGALARRLAQSRMLFFAMADEALAAGKTNPAEARLVARICATVWRLYADNGRTFDEARTLGVIVPYRNQISLIRSELLHLLGQPDHPLLGITIDTVERYQGSERDVIVYGFTAARRQQLQFLTSQSFEEGGKTIDRKLNVALTRAREQLFLVGRASLLAQNAVMRSLIDYARANGGYVDAAEVAAD